MKKVVNWSGSGWRYLTLDQSLKFASYRGGWGERSRPRSATAIHTAAVGRTPNLPIERRTLHHWLVPAPWRKLVHVIWHFAMRKMPAWRFEIKQQSPTRATVTALAKVQFTISDRLAQISFRLGSRLFSASNCKYLKYHRFLPRVCDQIRKTDVFYKWRWSTQLKIYATAYGITIFETIMPPGDASEVCKNVNIWYRISA